MNNEKLQLLLGVTECGRAFGCIIHDTMFSGTRSKSPISVTGEVIIP